MQGMQQNRNALLARLAPRPRSAASAAEPLLNLSNPLLYPPNLPRKPLSAFPVLLGRRIKFPLIVGNVGRQLGPLALKGLSLVRGQWHVGDDSAGGKSYAGNGRPCSSGPDQRDHARSIIQ